MFKLFIKTLLFYTALFIGGALIFSMVWKDSTIMMANVNQWFTKHQLTFLVYHALVYLAFYFAWPYWVKTKVTLQEEPVSDEQITKAIRARYWCIGALMLLDYLFVSGV